ncbi:hypothetical protein HanIR_Chr16g0838861 [Helianthus annuus]|nr:hypothetical protein HanIR_Chr16g0838861 [Helianthus annuus]
MLRGSKSVGSSHGLMCLHSDYFGDVRRDVAVIWNVLIGKAVAVAVPKWWEMLVVACMQLL